MGKLDESRWIIPCATYTYTYYCVPLYFASKAMQQLAWSRRTKCHATWRMVPGWSRCTRGGHCGRSVDFHWWPGSSAHASCLGKIVAMPTSWSQIIETKYWFLSSQVLSSFTSSRCLFSIVLFSLFNMIQQIWCRDVDFCFIVDVQHLDLNGAHI